MTLVTDLCCLSPPVCTLSEAVPSCATAGRGGQSKHPVQAFSMVTTLFFDLSMWSIWIISISICSGSAEPKQVARTVTRTDTVDTHFFKKRIRIGTIGTTLPEVIWRIRTYSVTAVTFHIYMHSVEVMKEEVCMQVQLLVKE